MIFTSLPGPPEVEAVALGANGLIAGMKPAAAYFDLSTNSPTLVRQINRRFAEKNALHARRAGQRRAARRRLGPARTVGRRRRAEFNRHKTVLDAIGDQARYIGPIGAGSVAKLVHNCAGYAIQCCLAEVFTMGVKAGVEPLALWEAVRQGAGGRRRTFDALGRPFPARQIRPARFRAAARAQGRDLGDPARARD